MFPTWLDWVLGRETTEVKCHSQHITSRVHTTTRVCDLPLSMLTLITWLRQYVSSFSIAKLLFFSPHFPLCVLWKEVPTYSPCLKSRELFPLPQVSVNSLKFFYMRELSLLPYLLSHLLISVWTHGYLFCVWVII